jgi:SPP1 gp7 family putative phage head morphogenesis protein
VILALARVDGWGWASASTRLDVVEDRGQFLVMNDWRTRVLGGPYATRAEAQARIDSRRAARLDAVVPSHVLAGETRAHATARTVAIHRLTGQASKRRRLPRQLYPHAIEADYGHALSRYVASVKGALAPLRQELPDIIAAAADERRVDSHWRRDARSTARMNELLGRARDAVARMTAPRDVENLARQFAQRTQTYQRIQLAKQTKAALGIDVAARDRRLPAIIDHFVGENVALIKTIPAHLLDDVEKVVTRGVTSGDTVDELDEQIGDRFGVSDRHARLIARDQTTKLYGQVNAYRQQDLGVERFWWRTAGDERVREEHEELGRGGPYSYDDPPDEGLPGEPIQCRCYAEPDFESIKDLADVFSGDADDDSDASTDDPAE